MTDMLGLLMLIPVASHFCALVTVHGKYHPPVPNSLYSFLTECANAEPDQSNCTQENCLQTAMPYKTELETAVAALCIAGAGSHMQLICAGATFLMHTGSNNSAARLCLLPVGPLLRSGLLMGLKLEIPKPCPGSCAALDMTEVTRSDAADPSSDMFLSRAMALLLAASGSCVVRSLACPINLDIKFGEDAVLLSSSSENDMLSELLSEPAATEKEVGQAEEEPSNENISVMHFTPQRQALYIGIYVTNCTNKMAHVER